MAAAAPPPPPSRPPKRRGLPEETYKFSVVLQSIIILAICLMVAFNVLLWAPLHMMEATTPSDRRARQGMRIFAFLSLVGCAGALAWERWISKSEYLLYPDALVHRRDGVETALHFADCELSGFYGHLTLKDRAGRTLTISRYTGDRHELRQAMAKRITALQLPGARERLQKGMTVIYGPFKLTSKMLGHEQRRIPWDQVGEVRLTIIYGRINVTKLTVYQHMKVLPWAYSFSAYDEVPNLDLCLALIDELKGRRPSF